MPSLPGDEQAIELLCRLFRYARTTKTIRAGDVVEVEVAGQIRTDKALEEQVDLKVLQKLAVLLTPAAAHGKMKP